MKLYQRISLETFVKGWQPGAAAASWTVPAVHLMYAFPASEIDYGLSVLRQSIGAYEEKKGIPSETSKREMPFFRENRRMLVGPEVELYVIPFYAGKEAAINNRSGAWGDVLRPAAEAGPSLILTFDYDKLLRHCLLENRFLVGCKYDAEQVSKAFEMQLAEEYDKFFYDAEHTGFAAGSRFFSMLCNACLEVKDPRFAAEKEWRMALFAAPEEAEYQYVRGELIPHLPVSMPADSLLEIELPGYEEKPLTYGALAGFLKRAGLSPGQYLKGVREEEA